MDGTGEQAAKVRVHGSKEGCKDAVRERYMGGTSLVRGGDGGVSERVGGQVAGGRWVAGVMCV